MLEMLLPLAGVLVGVAASFVATSVHERGAFRRTMATRWDDRRIETYIAYIAAVKATFRAARSVREAGAADAREHLRAREDAEAQRSLLFESVVLLAGPATAEAAHEVNRRVWRVSAIATTTPDEGDEAFAGAEEALFAAIADFHGRARLDLGVGAPSPVA